jgi:hypothetical protein
VGSDCVVNLRQDRWDAGKAELKDRVAGVGAEHARRARSDE